MLHNPALDGRIADEDFAQLFDQLAPALHDFSERHSLFLRKYLKDMPIWAFYFRHPLGGTGALQFNVGRTPSGAFEPSTAGSWYVDDEENLTRSTFRVPVENLRSLQEAEIVEGLSKLLTKLLTAQPSSRTVVCRISERRTDTYGVPVYSDFERALQLPK